MGWQASVAQWGSTEEERAQPFPCDRLIAAPELTLFRAVDVAAPRALTFRWLCQLRGAPYSYDRLDNFGVRSPQELTPGLEALEPGQRMQTIFRLVEFEPGRSLTMLHRGRLFGRVACTYRADGLGEQRSRIVVKVNVSHRPRGLLGPLLRLGLAPGDLLMMRRQLLNLKRLAERTAGEPVQGQVDG
jgi:hypothetical protein